MEDSIFTKIIKGDIPCYKIYENDKVLAFLDIHPAQPGHTLVIPKKQIDHLWDLPDEDYDAVMRACKKVANHMRKVFPNKKRVAVHVVGLDVPHAHIHLYPFSTTAEYHTLPDDTAEPDHAALSEIAKKLAF